MTERALLWLRRGCLGCIGLILLLAVAAYLTFKVYERRFEQSRVPARTAITNTIYKLEKNWGVGPGGNETGIIIYGLDEVESRRLEQEGPSLIDDRLIRTAIGSAERDYYEWKRTPADTSKWQWNSNEPFDRYKGVSLILRYLNRYGFGVALPPSIASQIDRTLSTPGAYYAYGPGGSLIVIAPREQRLIIAYAG